MVHTPETFQAINIYLQKAKKPPVVFCTHLFFASEIILIFIGLFLHRKFRLLKVNIKSLMVTTSDLAREKSKTRRENPNSIKLSLKSRKKHPKGHIRKYTLFSTQFQKMVYVTYSSAATGLEGRGTVHDHPGHAQGI